MPLMDWLIMTDAPTVKVKVVKERKGREKNREKTEETGPMFGPGASGR